jgi:subtilisin family serine protease
VLGYRNLFFLIIILVFAPSLSKGDEHGERIPAPQEHEVGHPCNEEGAGNNFPPIQDREPFHGQREVCSNDDIQFICGEILVRFPSFRDIAGLLEEHELEQVRTFRKNKLRLLRRRRDARPERPEAMLCRIHILRELGALYAEPNLLLPLIEATANDTSYQDLWGLANIGVESVWDLSTAGSRVIAVIDSGIEHTHEDLSANLWANQTELSGLSGVDDDANGYVDDIFGYDFVNDDDDPLDDHGHGTHVAGTIGAVGNNSIGVTGVQWKTQLMALKTLSADGYGTMSDAVAAIEYAIENGASVINASWGSGGYSSALDDVIEYAESKGLIFVAAAGNSSKDTDFTPHYPSSLKHGNIISVASITEGDDLSTFSNYGDSSVDLGAPGSSIVSTYIGNSYLSLSGTSMATPHVSGATALLWSEFPERSAQEIIQLILEGARPLSALQSKCVTEGTLDLEGSFEEADGQSINHTPIAHAGSSFVAGLNSEVTLSGSGFDEDADLLSYSWSLKEPGGSWEVITENSTSANIAFTVDSLGTYTARLSVHDGQVSSANDYVFVYASDDETKLSPSASFIINNKEGEAALSVDTNGNPVIIKNNTIVLDASSSFSYDEESALEYEWSLVDQPSTSTSSLSNDDQITTSFLADASGLYQIKLQIVDSQGRASSESWIVSIEEESDEPVEEEEPDEGQGKPSQPGESDPDENLAAQSGCTLIP